MSDELVQELTRRNVIRGAIGSGALGALSGGSLAQVAEVDESVLQDAAFLLGIQPGDPNQIPELAPDGPFFSGSDWTKERYAYIYRESSGAEWYLTQSTDRWQPLPIQAPSYAEADLPTDIEPGQIYYNSDRDVLAFSDGNDYEYPVVGDDILVSPTTVANTTAETLIWDAGLSAGSLKVGRVYEVSLFGKFSNASTADIVTLNVYLGGVLVASVGSTGKNADAAPWRAKTIFTVRETGGSGEVQPHTLAKFNQEDADDHHPPETIDTTVPEQIEVYAQWNNAKTGNTITLGQGYMKEIS